MLDTFLGTLSAMKHMLAIVKWFRRRERDREEEVLGLRERLLVERKRRFAAEERYFELKLKIEGLRRQGRRYLKLGKGAGRRVRAKR